MIRGLRYSSKVDKCSESLTIRVMQIYRTMMFSHASKQILLERRKIAGVACNMQKIELQALLLEI